MPRSAPPRARAPRAPRGSRARSPPDGGLELFGLDAVPKICGEVLPARVGEDRDDDALVELRCELAGDVDHCARRDAGEDTFLVEEPAGAAPPSFVRPRNTCAAP